MSWEETLREVVRRYYRAGPSEPPDWVAHEGPGSSPAVTLSNATCGDRVVVHMAPSGEGSSQPMRVWLDVAGCAICKASAEMAVRAAQAMSPEELETLARQVHASLVLTSDCENRGLDRLYELTLTSMATVSSQDIETMLRLRDVPGRQRCASLPWEAVLHALDASR